MIKCDLCFHHCQLNEDQIGFCRARQNSNEIIVPLYYGQVSSIALDPIEKKPLAHFYPGSKILSIGSVGCNLKCPFCQNHEISMALPNQVAMQSLSPQEAVDLALKLKKQGNIGLAFTYNEPLINYEYVLDTAQCAKKAGLITVLVTNGTIEPLYLESLLPFIDALNIDLKGFTQRFYDLVGGDLDCVKNTIECACQMSHVEITTLIIPGINDSDSDMEAEAQWLAALNPDLPLHLTRFFPRFQYRNMTPTPLDTLVRLKKIADQYLSHVYLGNV